MSDNLNLSRNNFYKEQNFAHGFVELLAMPERNLEKLSQLQGIKEINGRIVEEVRVNIPGFEENVYLKLVSIELSRERRINEPKLLQGEALGGKDLSIWIDNQ
ncbi:MAG: hypothetical protein ACOYBM_03750 [Dethiobacteria bacterium]